MSDILGIRLMHPQIPERNGYIMCVERASAAESATELYGRYVSYGVAYICDFSKHRTIFLPSELYAFRYLVKIGFFLWVFNPDLLHQLLSYSLSN
jgi:hypothetical protein